eukprot:2910-Heterococcus_DN1.PRE.1
MQSDGAAITAAVKNVYHYLLVGPPCIASMNSRVHYASARCNAAQCSTETDEHTYMSSTAIELITTAPLKELFCVPSLSLTAHTVA